MEMNELTTNDKIDRVNAWQKAGFVHPLTCYNSNHPLLAPVIHKENWGESVILKCPKCGYTQKIPPSILSISPEEINQEKERLTAKGFKFSYNL